MNNQALFVVLCQFCQRLCRYLKSGPNLQMDNHQHPRTTRITLDSLLRAKIKTMPKMKNNKIGTLFVFDKDNSKVNKK